jgi:hypothetical protein
MVAVFERVVFFLCLETHCAAEAGELGAASFVVDFLKMERVLGKGDAMDYWVVRKRRKFSPKF